MAGATGQDAFLMTCSGNVPPPRRPRGRSRRSRRDYVFQLTWEHLGIPPDGLAQVAGEREIGVSLLKLFRHYLISGRTDGWMVLNSE